MAVLSLAAVLQLSAGSPPLQAQDYTLPVGSDSFSIPDLGGWSITSNGTAETVRVGYGRIRANTGSPTPSGIAIFQFRNSAGVLISEAGVPATEPVLEGRIFAEVNGSVNTGLAIANPNDETAIISFYFTDTHGTNFGMDSFELGALQQTAKFLNEPPFNGESPVLGTFTFESSVPIAVIALRGFTNEADEFLVTTLPVAPLSSASEETVYFPHFAAGGGWVTQVILVNPTDLTITGTVGFLGPGSETIAASPMILTLDDGSTGSDFDYSISPRSSQRFTTSNPSGALNTGSVRAVPDSGNVAPSGLVVFSYAPAGKTLSEAGVPALPKGSAFRVYAEASGTPGQAGSISTGLAIANVEDTSNTVTLEVTHLDGSLAAAPAMLTLPPSGQVARFLNDIFSLPDDFSGILRITSSAEIAVIGLRLRVNEHGEIKITTTPPSNETEASTMADTFFPHIADSGGWSTQFILFSGTAGQVSSGTLNFFDPSGEPLYLAPPGSVGRFYLGQVRLSCGDCDTFEDVTVVLTGNGVLETTTPNLYGQFGFFGLADGDYEIQVRKPGYRPPPARSFRIEGGVYVTDTEKEFILEPLDPNTFIFHWEEDQSTAGYDYASYVNQPLAIEFLDEETEIADSSSANRLLHDYNISLVNDGGDTWTHEHAYRLLRTMETIPQRKRDPYRVQSLPASQWFIAPGHVEDDIQIADSSDGTTTVWVSADAFVNASPRLARVEGKRGSYYSQRLHHALVRFITDNGQDVTAYEKILQERYDVTTRITRHTSYEALTANTTDELASRFQDFHAEEIIQIINMFEEMPTGMHVVSGLQYLVRRLDGTPNPYRPTAPAIAWTTAGYIEFMDKAFLSSSVLHTHRLIVHEKVHFLWEHLFDAQLKEDWIALGGWYPDANDPDGWSTTKQTEFVSAYAHGKNPNEDMAESIAYFIVNPDKLRSRSIAKYEFVRDRIMQGNIYISRIREDLTFEVYNLYPDYVYPGKIRRVDIEVTGASEEDKKVRIEIELHALDEELEGATKAYTRIFSDVGTYTDLYLYPVGVPRGQTGTVLSGSFTLSKYAKAGYWSTDQISITDEHSNKRFEGLNDFGWSLYINNPLEDVTPPRYVRNSASLTKSSEIREGQEVQLIEAAWGVDEDSGTLNKGWPCYASLNDENPNTYRFQEYGPYDPQERMCRVTFVMPHYMPSSVYTMHYVWMKDRALNQAGVYFGDPGHGLRQEQSIVDEAAQQIELVTNNPDTEPPELDVENISIHAEPTQPEAPNGETLVTLEFRIRDNISGFCLASADLRDPQGIDHFFYIYPPDGCGNLFPSGDPSQWTDYSWQVLLPVGSAPGIWGLAEMTVRDRAENFKAYDFTEIIHFDVGGQ